MKCYVLKTIILGDCGVGKTTMLYRYYNGTFNTENNSTVGVNFVSKYVKTLGNEFADIVKLQIWDTAGQERFRSIIRSYYHNVCGCIVAYDITNRNSFDNSNYWMNEVRKNNPNVSIILVGTKRDLEHERQVDYEEGVKLSNYFQVPFFEITSKQCVNNVFDKLVELIAVHIKITDNEDDETDNENAIMKGVVTFDNFEFAYQEQRRVGYLNRISSASSQLLCCNN